jgi:hypothetical protein
MDARSILPLTFRNIPLDRLEDQIVTFCNAHRVQWIFVDGTGVGGGVVDHLRRRGFNVVDVQFGAKPDQQGLDQVRYANKRAEIWGIMRDKLQYLGLPNSTELRAQLIGPEYGFNIRGELQLEPKDVMKRRGVASPDIADALACTFASEMATVPVADWEGPGDHLVRSNYNPFADPFETDANALLRHEYAPGWARLREDD